jgi:hypothetical protein
LQAGVPAVIAAAGLGVGGTVEPEGHAAAGLRSVVWADGTWLVVPAAAAAAAAGARYTVSCLSVVRAILMTRLPTYAARGWEGLTRIRYCLLPLPLSVSLAVQACSSASPATQQHTDVSAGQ